MCNKYDRAHCVNELGVRVEIMQEIEKGRKPCDEFEIPKKGGEAEAVPQSSSCDETSIVSTPSHLRSEVDISKLDE